MKGVITRKREFAELRILLSRQTRVKIKESEKKDNYQDLAWERKNQWNMKVMVIPVVIGAMGTITKGSLQEQEDLEIRGRVSTIQFTTILRSARVLKKPPGDLKRLAVTQTPLKNHWFTLACNKSLKVENNKLNIINKRTKIINMIYI